MIRVQAFGAGVQSVAMLRLILAGRVDRPHAIIFADTGAEPTEVYHVVERESALCEAAGIPFRTVHWRDMKQDTGSSVHLPLFTERIKDGKHGMLGRSCTSRFKIEPIERALREMGAKTEPGGAEQYMGISTDEIQRVKPSRKSYITLRYPLIEMNWNRNDCVQYLASLGIEAAKSACVMCPYRSKTNWEAVKANPDDWDIAVAFDSAVRMARAEQGVRSYVHVSRRPLPEAVDDPAPSLFDDECSGYCAL